MDIEKILQGCPCSCGKIHSCDIKHIIIENGALSSLGKLTEAYRRILLVADENTYRAAGKKTEANLKEKEITRQIFQGRTVLIPNEEAICAVTKKSEGAELIIGIGSGVIQDLCKYVSHKTGIPYYIVATAPSMDGYASTGAAMITDGMKVTYTAKVPEAIIADVSVLKDAPIEMIKAGYGDIVGKYSALNDWKLGHIVNGEYFCQTVYDLTYQMLKKTVPLAKKLLCRDPESIKTLTEALIIVGVAMSFAGNSRPASGSEHHLSHFFEITGIIDGEDYLPHGIDVALSTVITSKIRSKILNSVFPEKSFVMPEDEYKSEISRVYSSVADGCISLQERLGTYKTDRMSSYLMNEEKIRKTLAEAPSSQEIENILSEIELDTDLLNKTYSAKKIADAICYAKDLKDRYTVLWMYYDLFGKETV